MTIFMCLQIEDFKRHYRGGRIADGKCVTKYTVKLNDKGRPVWVRHAKPIYWCVGYADCEAKCKKEVKKRWHTTHADTPYIQTANLNKLVSKSEAQALLGKHWLPAAALDYLTEQLQEQGQAARGEGQEKASADSDLPLTPDPLPLQEQP